MRGSLLAVLLLWAPGAFAAWCDEDEIVAANVNGECPGVNSNLQATPGHECVLITYTSTSTSGSSYAYVIPGLNQLPPGCESNLTILDRKMCVGDVRDEWIVQGVGADAYKSQVATSGERTMELCGLAPQADYTLTLLDKDGPNLGGLFGEPLTVSFTMTAAPTPPGSSDPPELYAHHTGTNMASGLTWDVPVRTLTYAKSLLGPGDDLCLKPGAIFEDQQYLDPPSGTPGDRQITGTCYDDTAGSGGYPWYDEGSAPLTAQMAEINGTYEMAGCRAIDPLTCPFSTTSNPSAIPSNYYGALVRYQERQYNTLVGVKIHDSSGNALQINENYTTQSKFVGKHLDIEGATARAVQVTKAVDGGGAFFSDLDIRYCSLRFVDGHGSPWSGCISFDSNTNAIDADILVQNTSIVWSGGEAYTTLRIGGVLFRDSFVARSRNVMFYCDAASRCGFERMYGIGTGWYDNQPPDVFVFGVECYTNSQSAVDNFLRDSLVINAGHNAFAGNSNSVIRGFIEGPGGCEGTPEGFDIRDDGFQTSATVAGNTFIIDPDIAQVIVSYNLLTSDGLAYLRVHNNIFQGKNVCNMQNDPDVEFDFNAWSAAPSGLVCDGASDSIGVTGYTNDETWDHDNVPAASSFTLPVGSVALDAGTPRTNAMLDILNYPYWDQGTVCSPTEAQFEQESALDMFCTLRDLVTPNAGHWEGAP